MPGKSEASRIVRALRRDSTEIAPMPPDKPLNETAIQSIERWIDMGAVWPTSQEPPSLNPTETHWSFQALKRVSVPRNDNPHWNKEPIDRWLFDAMRSRDLQPSEPADSRILARRLAYDLTGLPPTQEQIEQLEGFQSEPSKVEELVDELLDSTAFAEHWARHWLDIARYGDTLGELEDGEDFNPHAYLYRDWVIRAFQDDLPYNEFIRLQLHADQLVEPHSPDLAALGFLTVGLKFEDNDPDIIDDRLDTIFRGLQGLSISCARCHDHKYDPITTEDYYSLYGIFAESSETTTPVFQSDEDREVFARYASELRLLQFQFDRFVDEQRRKRYGSSYEHVASYLLASSRVGLDESNLEDEEERRTDGLHPTLIRRYRDAMESAKSEHSPIFAPWIAYSQTESLEQEEIEALARKYSRWRNDADTDTELEATEVSDATNDVESDESEQINETENGEENEEDNPIHPSVAEFFMDSPPKSKEELAQRYGVLFLSVATEWRGQLENAWENGTEAPTKLSDERRDEIRQLLFGDEPVLDVNIDTIKDSLEGEQREQFDALQNAVIEFQNSDTAPPQARIISDGGEREQYVFIRGNPDRPGVRVEPRFLSLLDPEQEVFAWETGRGDLARAITDPHNPLTARVWVNRVWGYLFGQGIVDSPSDFGTRGSTPSHPELLDRLSLDFIKHGWSTRQLIRRIVLSAAYQQSSQDRPDMQAIDPTNRFVWRMNRKRLSNEMLRDSLLVTSDQLDEAVGGKAIRDDGPQNRRRTIYSEVNRRHLSGLAKTFDFANPMMHSPQRYETIVPQQTLWLWNGEFATSLLQDVDNSYLEGEEEPDQDEFEDEQYQENSSEHNAQFLEQTVGRLYLRVLQRNPTDEELRLAVSFLEQVSSISPAPILDDYSAWRYGTAVLNRHSMRLEDFTELTDTEDENWVAEGLALSASGGELGARSNDRVLVRRWIVPNNGILSIDSTVSHTDEEDSPDGDGIAAIVLRNEETVVGKSKVKNIEKNIRKEELSVHRGDTIDFIAHPRKNSVHDRFEWRTDLVLTPEDGSAVWTTNSEQHFRSEPAPIESPLSGLAQLMQVLWMSNEFLYVD